MISYINGNIAHCNNIKDCIVPSVDCAVPSVDCTNNYIIKPQMTKYQQAMWVALWSEGIFLRTYVSMTESIELKYVITAYQALHADVDDCDN